MQDCQRLLALTGASELRWGEHRCDPRAEPERLTVAEAFQRHAGVDLFATVGSAEKLARAGGIAMHEGDSWDDVFFRIMFDRIESKLGMGRPTILCEYPIAMAALARAKPGDPRVAERFELYVCGVELANAFGELTDPDIQRARLAGRHGREGAAVRRALAGRRGFPGGARSRPARLRRHRPGLRPPGDARHRRQRISRTCCGCRCGEGARDPHEEPRPGAGLDDGRASDRHLGDGLPDGLAAEHERRGRWHRDLRSGNRLWSPVPAPIRGTSTRPLPTGRPLPSTSTPTIAAPGSTGRGSKVPRATTS